MSLRALLSIAPASEGAGHTSCRLAELLRVRLCVNLPVLMWGQLGDLD